MPLDKPSNFYLLSWDEQRDWERQAESVAYQERQAEYDLQRAKQDAEYEYRKRQQQVAAAREEYSQLQEDYTDTSEKLGLANGFIRAKGLWSEFAEWLKKQR